MSAKKILVVDDEKMIRWVLCQALRDWGYTPIEAATIKAALELFDARQPALSLFDINLPDGSGLAALRAIRQRNPNASVVMLTANAVVENTLAALRAGACDFLVKPIDLDVLQATVRACLREEEEVSAPSESVTKPTAANFNHQSPFGFESIIGESPKMKELLTTARKIAQSDVGSVLLQGESGTGKDLIAKAIHYSSPRAGAPLVAINCAAIPTNLLESELFGHEKGSFTDAKQKKEGLLEQAGGGTIFLDEIGELELGLQAKLLRVLEEGVFRRVGGLKDLRLDSCVIAASNRNLREASATGDFRRDLYFRLSVMELHVPPLRERGEDVIILAAHFIKTLDRKRFEKKPRRLAPETAAAFRRYDWSGNVRELRNVIERALILEESEQITLKYMPHSLSRFTSHNKTSPFVEPGLDRFFQLPPSGISLEAVEDSLIEQALQRTNGNVTRAAEMLKISRDRMRYHIKKKMSAKFDNKNDSG